MKKIITIFNIKGGVGSTSLAHMLSSHLKCNVYEEKADYFTYLGNGKIIDPNNIKVGVYDINTKQSGQLINAVLTQSDVIIIPTHFGFMDISKTCSTLSMAIEASSKKTKKPLMFVLFNNLSVAAKDREQKYRKKAQTDIYEAIKSLHFKHNADRIQYLYFRNSFAVFRGSESGLSLLDHYIKPNGPKEMLDNNEHLELLYRYVYHTEKEIEPFLRDNYTLLYSKPEFASYYDSKKSANEISFAEDYYQFNYKKKLSTKIDEPEHMFDKRMLTTLYHLKFLGSHRKPVRDLRNLLIAIGEYIHE